MLDFLSRLQSMTPLDRLEFALRSAWLPMALLLIALSTVFLFGGDRESLYRPGTHNAMSSHHLTVAVNISPEHGFQRFERQIIEDDGIARYKPYNRFPIGGYASIKLATLPVIGDLSAQIAAARIVMLLFVSGAAVLAYLSLCRLASNRWIALTATLLAFSSYYLLYYNDMIAASELGVFFGLMLTFHGMVVFIQEGRFRQLVVKTCIGLLLGWVIFALLLPFIIIGLASELMRARSVAATSPHQPTVLHRGKLAAALLLRSRYTALGIAALLFGMSVLTFNFAMEYIALDGETALIELPSFQSMVKRIGGDDDFNTTRAAYLSWRPFLGTQFRSILRMFIPYTLLGSDNAAESPTWLSKRWSAVFGVALSIMCMIGSLFIRPRILFVTLASFGFVWAVPMRNTTALHEFESIYYIGLPLVFFTIVLLLVRRLTNRDGVLWAAAVIALLFFTVSSFQMSRVGHSAETARISRAMEEELTTIRELTAGELVTVLNLGGSYRLYFGWAHHAVNYYLNSSFIKYRYPPALERGFILMRERVDTNALLTPENHHFFLYDTAGIMAWYRAMYRSIVSTEPAAREEFDLYINDGTLHYIKEPCEREETFERFFLHVYPIDENDLPDDRRQHGFDNLDFEFIERGLLFDGKCLASIVLPQYDTTRIVTGRIEGNGRAWMVDLTTSEAQE